MADYVLFGDAEAAVCEIVREDANVAALGALTVTTDLVGFTAGARWVCVTRTGGIPTLWMRLDNPTVSVDVYAPDKGAAHDLAAAARGAVFAASGAYAGNGLALFDVADAAGLTWAPDEPGGPHYTLTLSLVTRPT